jgi:site-specific DNA-methyltransferase (adenine-specific)
MNESLNRIYNMDCLEGMERLLNKYGEGCMDMILCDLPYGTTRNKWDSIIPLGKLWNLYERLIKDNGAIVLTAQSPFDKVLGVSNLKLLKYEWIWKKDKGTGFLNAKKMPLKAHENILVFYKKLPTYNPQFWESKPMNSVYKSAISNGGNYGEYRPMDRTTLSKEELNTTKRYPVSVLNFSSVNNYSHEKTIHPTQKPLALFEYLIKTYTNEGDIVLDNCMGSGTTAIACLNTNRRFIGFELEREYFDLSNKRIEYHEKPL